MTGPVLAVIPARGGSRGIPRKNLVPLAGRPLLAWTIAAAREARGVDRVVVSSDDPEILAAARAHGAEPLRRPAALATDAARSEPVLRHAVDAACPGAGTLCLLQPTSPLRTGAHVDGALSLLSEDREAEAVVSVFEPAHSPFKAFQLDGGGYLVGVVDGDAPFRPRQELPATFFPNGAIYAVRADAFRATGSLLGRGRALPYVMTRGDSLDIDDWDDLRRAEDRLVGKLPTRPAA